MHRCFPWGTCGPLSGESGQETNPNLQTNQCDCNHIMADLDDPGKHIKHVILEEDVVHSSKQGTSCIKTNHSRGLPNLQIEAKVFIPKLLETVREATIANIIWNNVRDISAFMYIYISIYDCVSYIILSSIYICIVYVISIRVLHLSVYWDLSEGSGYESWCYGPIHLHWRVFSPLAKG